MTTTSPPVHVRTDSAILCLGTPVVLEVTLNPDGSPNIAPNRHEPARFEVAGLTLVPSELVAPPRIAECPVGLECRVSRQEAGGPVVEFDVLGEQVHPSRLASIDEEKYR